MIRKVFSHLAILLSNMYLVFYLIDRVNSAMSFIDNNITKGLLVVLCIVSTINASFLIYDARQSEALQAYFKRRSAQQTSARSGPVRQSGAQGPRISSGSRRVPLQEPRSSSNALVHRSRYQ